MADKIPGYYPENARFIEERVHLNGVNFSLPVYVVGPDDEGSHPAVILVHEIFGLNSHIESVAKRLAYRGYQVYAPDLFAGAEVDRQDLVAMRDYWQGLADDDLISDLQTVFSYARSSAYVAPAAVGAMGYCMGGAIAYMFACRTPLLAWVANYYGRIFYPQLTDKKPRHPVDYTGGLNCPLLGFFAGIDDLISKEQIQHLENKLSELGKSFNIKVYEQARHAFFNDERAFYNSESAHDAWQLTMAFVDRIVLSKTTL